MKKCIRCDRKQDARMQKKRIVLKKKPEGERERVRERNPKASLAVADCHDEHNAFGRPVYDIISPR